MNEQSYTGMRGAFQPGKQSVLCFCVGAELSSSQQAWWQGVVGVWGIHRGHTLFSRSLLKDEITVAPSLMWSPSTPLVSFPADSAGVAMGQGHCGSIWKDIEVTLQPLHLPSPLCTVGLTLPASIWSDARPSPPWWKHSSRLLFISRLAEILHCLSVRGREEVWSSILRHWQSTWTHQSPTCSFMRWHSTCMCIQRWSGWEVCSAKSHISHVWAGFKTSIKALWLFS